MKLAVVSLMLLAVPHLTSAQMSFDTRQNCLLLADQQRVCSSGFALTKPDFDQPVFVGSDGVSYFLFVEDFEYEDDTLGLPTEDLVSELKRYAILETQRRYGADISYEVYSFKMDQFSAARLIFFGKERKSTKSFIMSILVLEDSFINIASAQASEANVREHERAHEEMISSLVFDPAVVPRK